MELIPGLPNDLGLQCLTNIPYKFHRKIRATYKSWNALLSSTQFYKQRQVNGAWEGGVVSLSDYIYDEDNFLITIYDEDDFNIRIYYQLGHWWEKLPQIPEEFGLKYTIFHRCVYVKSKQQLVVMGLNSRNGTTCVLIFDFLSRRWRLGTDMPINIVDFACAASPTKGLLYVAGGYHWAYDDDMSPYLLEAFVYNVEENNWDFLPAMNSDPLLDSCSAVFLDGKFYVVPREQSQSALQVYDPRTRLCRNIDNDGNAQYIHSWVDAIAGVVLRFGQ